MARYIASNPIPAGCAGHEFIGWDKIGGRSTEATKPENLGMKMPKVMAQHFGAIDPGQEIKVATGRLFREF